MAHSWTKVAGPDAGDGAFRVRIAPDFHAGEGLLLATPCGDLDEATRFAGLVDRFLRMMVEDYSEQEVAHLGHGGSVWTHVYFDRDPYVRLTPGYMDMEAAGYPHGLALAPAAFRTKAEAEEASRAVEAEMHAMLASLVAALPGGHPLAAVAATIAGPGATASEVA